MQQALGACCIVECPVEGEYSDDTEQDEQGGLLHPSPALSAHSRAKAAIRRPF
jgi:hypothetical protein